MYVSMPYTELTRRTTLLIFLWLLGLTRGLTLVLPAPSTLRRSASALDGGSPNNASEVGNAPAGGLTLRGVYRKCKKS